MITLLAAAVLGCSSHLLGINGGVDYLRASADPTKRELMQSLGAQAIRIGAGWATVEKTKGVFSWVTLDDRLKSAAASGMKPYLLLDARNDLYGGVPTSDTSRAAYAKFCGAVAARYAGYSPMLEVANEPNEERFWPSPDPEMYAKCLMAAAREIKRRNPVACVVGYSLSGTDPAWLEPGLQDGVLQYVDAISVHPYGDYSAPDLRPMWYAADRAMIARYSGDKEIGLIASESGWSTGAMMPDLTASPWALGLITTSDLTASGWNRANCAVSRVIDADGAIAYKLSPDATAMPFGISRVVSQAQKAGDVYIASCWVRTDGPQVEISVGPCLSGLPKLSADGTWRRVAATVRHDGSARVFKLSWNKGPRIPLYVRLPMTERAPSFTDTEWLAECERTAADRMRRSVELDRAAGLWGTFWFEAEDGNRDWNQARENNFGLFTRDGRKKAAYQAFQELARPTP